MSPLTRAQSPERCGPKRARQLPPAQRTWQPHRSALPEL